MGPLCIERAEHEQQVGDEHHFPVVLVSAVYHIYYHTRIENLAVGRSVENFMYYYLFIFVCSLLCKYQ